MMAQKRTQAIAAINRTANKSPIPTEQFKVGDQVWLEASHLKLPYHTPKLAPRRQGPFKVSEVISPVAYRLALPLSWGIHNVFHASLLLPYKETAMHGPNFTRPPPDLVGDEEEYEVEAIANHRHFGRHQKLQYLIKWKGYPSSDNMWEPEENVHAEDLVKEYHRRHPLNPHKSRGGQGTRKLVRALQTPNSSPSPTDRIKAWLLASSLETFPLHTRIALRSTSECSPSPPISPWLSMPSNSSKRGSQERARKMPGSSYNNSRASYGRMSGTDETRERGLVKVALQKALLKAIRQVQYPKIPPCQTPPSGRGRPL